MSSNKYLFHVLTQVLLSIFILICYQWKKIYDEIKDNQSSRCNDYSIISASSFKLLRFITSINYYKSFFFQRVLPIIGFIAKSYFKQAKYSVAVAHITSTGLWIQRFAKKPLSFLVISQSVHKFNFCGVS